MIVPPRYFVLAALLSGIVSIVGQEARAADAPVAAPHFGRQVLPILSEHCFQCHGPDAKGRKGDLRLDQKEAALRTDSPVIVPGNADRSELLRRIVTQDADERMPPPASKKTLTSTEIEILRRWIDAGAPWGKHWAYEPIEAPPLPNISTDEPALQGSPLAVRGPLDAHIVQRLARDGLRVSPPAAAATLARRLTLDLTGLPPTLDELDAFVADENPDSTERLVDRLLASPRFGERMVWDWLDAARYADSNGYQGDAERTMWPWRDWAVDALNRGLPFDQFTIWQLAGDLLPDSTPEQKLATGFCRNHMINGEGGRIAAENRVDYVMDMTETTGTVWLGLTFNCCRCHDHKYDPLTQTDYYQLFAFFNNTPVDGGGGNPQTPPVLDVPAPRLTEQIAAARQAEQVAAKQVDEAEQKKFPRESGQSAADAESAAGLPEAIRNVLKLAPAARNRAQSDQLAQHFKDLDAAYSTVVVGQRAAIDAREGLERSVPRVMIMQELPQPRDAFILSKGLYDKPLGKVGIDVPASLPRLPADAKKDRLALARWLVGADNPLTARVVVNRFWQAWFGAGIVKTTEDFGLQGERPVHPELLDRLAADFVRSGWDVKQLARQTLTSGTYRQSSRASRELIERDPENRLLARGPRYRLPAWMLRDQALAASGLMVHAIGGPPVRPYQPAGVWEEATFGNKRYQQDHGASLYRRSMYTFWRRIIAPTEFFDSASRQTCTVKQVRTNTPLHALIALNDVTFVEAARALAERALREAGPAPDAWVERVFLLIVARAPTPEERDVLVASVAKFERDFATQPEAAKKYLTSGESPRDERLDVVQHAARMAVANLLLNLDETQTKE